MKLLYFAIYQIMINGILHVHLPSLPKEHSSRSFLTCLPPFLKEKNIAFHHKARDF